MPKVADGAANVVTHAHEAATSYAKNKAWRRAARRLHKREEREDVTQYKTTTVHRSGLSKSMVPLEQRAGAVDRISRFYTLQKNNLTKTWVSLLLGKGLMEAK